VIFLPLSEVMILTIMTGSLLLFCPNLEPFVDRDLYRIAPGSSVLLEDALKEVTKASRSHAGPTPG
jgi:uncharacterized iron-regulated membrane protein